MTLLKPLQCAFVNITKAFEDEMTLPSGIKFYLDASFNKNENATVTGIIERLPVNPPKQERRILSNLQEGDEVCFSFRVCSNIERIVRHGVFSEFTHSDEKYLKRWTNAGMEWIIKAAMPTSTNAIQWTGVHTNKEGDVVSGVSGSESEVDRWLSNFSFISEDKFRFKNLLGIDGKDYWKVQLSEIFAKKTKDGIEAVGNKLLMKPIDIDVKHRLEIVKGIHIPSSSVNVRFYDRATALQDYEPFDIKKGDIVSFSENFVEKYKFWGEDYWLIKPHRIFGKWEGQPSLKNLM